MKLLAMNTIKGSKIQVEKIINKFDSLKEKHLDKIKDKVIEIEMPVNQAVLELLSIVSERNERWVYKDIVSFQKKFKARIKYIRRAENNEEFEEEVLELITVLDEIIKRDTNSIYLNRDADTLLAGLEYRNEVLHSEMESIAKCFTSKNFNIFDFDANRSERLKAFAEISENTYGLTRDESSIRSAREHAKHIVLGSYKDLYCQQSSFDLVILEARIKHSVEENTQMGRIYHHERYIIDRAFGYLRRGGYALLTIPIYRLSKNTASQLSRQFALEDIFKTNGYEDVNVVHMLLRKKEINENTEGTADYLMNLTMDDVRKYDGKLVKNIYFDKPSLDISIFKSSKFDATEADVVLENSTAFEEFVKARKNEVNAVESSKPLLPFNLGQIGLVLTSGCLDGVIDEGDGYCHMVKGRVSKKTDTVIERSSTSRERTDTITNRVEINILKPDGTFKTLV